MNRMLTINEIETLRELLRVECKDIIEHIINKIMYELDVSLIQAKYILVSYIGLM